MNTRNLTTNQIDELGIEALMNKLGTAGMIRFLHQHKMGKGNYSVDRHQWLNVPDVETLAHQIQQAREETDKTLQKTDETAKAILQDALQQAEEVHKELQRLDEIMKAIPRDKIQRAKDTNKELQKIDEAMETILKCLRPIT